MYGAAHVTGLEASRTLALLPAETVLQVPHLQLSCLFKGLPLHCRVHSGKLPLWWTAQLLLLAAVPVWEVWSIDSLL